MAVICGLKDFLHYEKSPWSKDQGLLRFINGVFQDASRYLGVPSRLRGPLSNKLAAIVRRYDQPGLHVLTLLRHLLHLEQFHLKDQSFIRPYHTTGTALTVAKVRWNKQTPFISFFHQL